MKARHLGLAIYDYYLQKLDERENKVQSLATTARPLSDEDVWTLQHIDLMHLQPIVEAIDEDASGYITVQEVNKFTAARPKSWRSVLYIQLPSSSTTNLVG